MCSWVSCRDFCWWRDRNLELWWVIRRERSDNSRCTIPTPQGSKTTSKTPSLLYTKLRTTSVIGLKLKINFIIRLIKIRKGPREIFKAFRYQLKELWKPKKKHFCRKDFLGLLKHTRAFLQNPRDFLLFRFF